MMIAYGSLVLMALFPIFVGAYRSVTSHKEQKENHVIKFMFLRCDGAVVVLEMADRFGKNPA